MKEGKYLNDYVIKCLNEDCILEIKHESLNMKTSTYVHRWNSRYLLPFGIEDVTVYNNNLFTVSFDELEEEGDIDTGEMLINISKDIEETGVIYCNSCGGVNNDKWLDNKQHPCTCNKDKESGETNTT